MRNLIKYFQSYFFAAWSTGYFLSVLGIAGILIYANYGWSWPAAPSPALRVARTVLVYALPYWCAFGLQFVFYRGLSFYRSWAWWVIVGGAPLLFAFHSSVLPGFAQGDYYRAMQYLLRAAVLIVPPLLFLRPSSLGLRRPDTWSYVPYLLLAMLPLLIFASGQPDFLQLYPRYKAVPHRVLPIAAYELGYGLDLFSMEFFFRGLLVVVLARVCKAHAILPAALFYCTAHFGKPLAECVSSLFGGVLLGVIAYESRSIWVGVLLHLCLAWGLEVLAFRP